MQEVKHFDYNPLKDNWEGHTHLYSKPEQLKRNNIYSLIKVCITAKK